MMTEKLGFVSQLRDRMATHHFMLSYRGFISQEITKALLALAERKLDLEGADRSIKKKVFNVMMECLQNICRHKDSYSQSNSALFMIGRSGNEYIVYSGNVIANSKIEGLRNKLVAINTMDAEDLKEMYFSLITSSGLSEYGGAGLGLIDIARRSGNKFSFDFEPINETISFFSLRTVINSVNNIEA